METDLERAFASGLLYAVQIKFALGKDRVSVRVGYVSSVGDAVYVGGVYQSKRSRFQKIDGKFNFLTY